MAEVPSTFAQAIADDYLLENELDPGTRAALAAAFAFLLHSIIRPSTSTHLILDVLLRIHAERR